MMQFSFNGEVISIEIEKSETNFSSPNMQLEYSPKTMWAYVNGRRLKVTVANHKDDWWVHIAGQILKLEYVEQGASTADEAGGLIAPMPGKILEVLVVEGQAVTTGQPLMIMEAMKMEHKIVSPLDGEVSALYYQANDQVEGGVTLMEIQETD